MPAKTTDLVDRYLNAVKFWLPGKQQKDILAELGEDLNAEMEEREAALGHPPEETDLVALLQRRGSPMRVASGYIPEQRLVNPAMLPLYRMVLKIVLIWVLAPLFAFVFLGPVFDSWDPAGALLRFLGEAARALFFVIGIVTTIFALMDRYYAKWVDQWDPRKLPHVPPAHQPMQWYNDFAGFAFGLAGCIFWVVMMWHRSEFVYPGGFRVILGSTWGQIYWIVLALTLARALVDLYCFLRRGWTRGQSWTRIALDAAWTVLTPVLLLLRAGNWIDIASPNLTAADAVKMVSTINNLIEVSLVCAIIVALVDVAKQLRLLYRGKSGRSAPVLKLS
jgi:hypothetical protein